MLCITWLIRRRAPGTINRVFRRLQLVSGGFVAFTHGTNDAQKTMGIIALALIAGGHLAPDADPPTWVIASAALAMAAGTYAGGWRIIKTLGTRIAKLDPPQGFAAQTACAAILWTTAHYGFPVSTTHTISGSVMGAGASRRLSAVRWGVAGSIVVAWVMTIPCAAAVGALMELVTRLPAGDAIVFVLAALIASAAFVAAAGRPAGSRPSRARPATSPAPEEAHADAGLVERPALTWRLALAGDGRRRRLAVIEAGRDRAPGDGPAMRCSAARRSRDASTGRRALGARLAGGPPIHARASSLLTHTTSLRPRAPPAAGRITHGSLRGCPLPSSRRSSSPRGGRWSRSFAPRRSA